MPTLAALIEALSSGDDTRAQRAVEQLPDLGTTALDEIEALLLSGDVDARWWATRALAGFTQAQAGDLLVVALGDEDPSVRTCAALALVQQPHEAAIPSLIDQLSSGDSLLARLAGDALIAAGADSVPALLAILENGDQEAATEAARALALIGDTRAVSALFRLLDSDSVTQAHWAEEGLEKMGIGMTFFKPYIQ